MGANLWNRGRSAQRMTAWAQGLLATGAAVLVFVGGVALATGGQPGGAAYAATPEPCSTVAPQVSAQQLGAEPSVSVTPNLGPSGSSATIRVYNFLPDQDVNAIFRVSGDPVVARGKTDANGEASLTFTVPTAPNGSYYILAAQDNRTCIHASTIFTIGPVPPTVTPSPRPTNTPAATPIATTTPNPTATPTKPAALPTPILPKAGNGLDSGSGLQVNLFMAVVALAVTASGFAVLGLSAARRKS